MDVRFFVLFLAIFICPNCAFAQTHKVEGVSIRVLILKHCFENNAYYEAQEIEKVVKLGASKGLKVTVIGNYYIAQDKDRLKIYHEKENEYDDLSNFISKQMKIGAVVNDTFLIYTIGHGDMDGGLTYLGNRKYVMEAIGKAIQRNRQRTIWWEFSCYSAAHLPNVTDLPESQQDLFVVIATSKSNLQSYFSVESSYMQTVFITLAENSNKIDVNNDNEITVKELADFLNSIKKGRGDLIFAKHWGITVFGTNLVKRLPIIDESGNRTFPKEYLLMPNP